MSVYVMDTHPLYWLKSNQKTKLSKQVLSIFEKVSAGDAHIYIPAPVIWELGALYKSQKLKLNKYPLFKNWVKEDVLAHPNISFIETELEDVLLSGDLRVNPDPFDSLIVAMALRLDLPLITKDRCITESKLCKVIW